MGEEKFFLPDQESLTISGRALDKLIQRGDGNAALLYLYILKNRGRIDRQQATGTLGYTEQQLYDATGTLKALGLISGGDAPPARDVEPADEFPNYSAEELTREMDSGSDFKPLLNEVEILLGKKLTENDLQILYGIYEGLHFPAEVILLLINYCIEDHLEKYKKRKTNLRGVEHVAYTWAGNDVTTLEQAMKYLKKRSLQKSAAGDLSRVLRLRGDDLTATQRKYIYAWLDMGFGPEAVELAYDKTVTNTGELKWTYLNKILQSWHSQGLHTREEVEQKDGGGRSRRMQRAPQADQKPDRAEMDRKKRLLERLKESPET